MNKDMDSSDRFECKQFGSKQFFKLTECEFS